MRRLLLTLGMACCCLWLSAQTLKKATEAEAKVMVAEINKTVPPSKRILRLRLRDREFEKTTSKKVKRIQPGEKGRLI